MSETTSHTPMPVPALELTGVGFSYPGPGGEPAAPVLAGVDLLVPEGAFALLIGGTGSGKTTLLRLAKPEIAPVGRREGSLRVFGREVAELGVAESSQLVGYVFQSPENQIVCDTVWHELAFGLENLGMGQAEMRRRMSEVCIFLGIEPWFRRRCAELSDGQRQIVALAAVLAMRPRLLLLDEPTAMLDPVAEKEFLSLLMRANRELGITVVVATHRPAPMVDYATEAFELVGGSLRRRPLGELGRRCDLGVATPAPPAPAPPALVLEDLWMRYDRAGAWVLRGCELTLARGEVRALIGGNGSGKSTLLSVAGAVVRTQRGRVSGPGLGSRALLPQQPKALLACETVREELLEWQGGDARSVRGVDAALGRLGLSGRADAHPYDLSGGQQQLLALEKLLLTRPQLLLLDEPTKGLDDEARLGLARRVRGLADQGCTVLVATHDIAFAQAVAHTVSLLFDGQTGEPEAISDFLADSWMWRA